MEIIGKVTSEASVRVEHGMGEQQLKLVAQVGEMSNTIAVVQARYADERLVFVVYKADAEELGLEVEVVE